MIHVKDIKSGRDLFILRLVEHFQFRKKMWSLGVDWTVWLYILIPSLLVGVYFYVNFWMGHYDWIYNVQDHFIPFVLLFLILGASLKTHLKEADILFIWQSESIVNKLQKYSIIYFCVVSVIGSIVQFILIAPLLIIYLEWPLQYIVNIFLFVAAYRILFTLIKRELNVRKSKWVYRILLLIVFAMSGGLFYWLIPLLTDVILTLIVTITTIIIITLLIGQIMKKRPRFYREVELEVEKRAKSVQLLFSQISWIDGPEFLSEKVKNSSRSRPVLFRKSGKIFRSFSARHSYMEIFIKSILRNSGWLALYIQLIGFGSFAMIIVPEYLRWAIWLLFVFVIGNLMKSFLGRVLVHPFLTVVTWPEVNKREIVYYCMLIGLLPGALILSLLFNVLNFSIWGIAFGLVSAVILTIVFARFFATRVITK